MRKELYALKKLLFARLYRHEKLVRRMFRGKVCIRELYEAFHEEPAMLPPEMKERLEAGHKPHRVIADFIAALSDRAALDLHRKLY